MTETSPSPKDVACVNPYIDTILYTMINLHPSQLDNNIYVNLKKNLVKQYEKTCYKNYGYIEKIYEIIEHDNGHVVADDDNACVSFHVKFSCRLCHPIEETQIIAIVKKTSEVYVNLEIGPIIIFVSVNRDRFNANEFYINPYDKQLTIKSEKQQSANGDKKLTVGTYVKTTIKSKGFTHKDIKIRCLGTLDGVASDAEVEQLIQREYDTSHTVVPYPYDAIPIPATSIAPASTSSPSAISPISPKSGKNDVVAEIPKTTTTKVSKKDKHVKDDDIAVGDATVAQVERAIKSEKKHVKSSKTKTSKTAKSPKK